MKKEALRLTTTVPVAPTTLYYAWLDSAQHSSMTGGDATMISEVGAKYSAWNGYITGKMIALDLGRRIVMSWRTTDFPNDAADSRVELHFESLGGGTRILVLHTDIPEGQSEQFRVSWNEKYFMPLRTYFAKALPDPRLPPPVRKPMPPTEPDDEEEAPGAATPAKPAKPNKPAAVEKALTKKPEKSVSKGEKSPKKPPEKTAKKQAKLATKKKPAAKKLVVKKPTAKKKSAAKKQAKLAAKKKPAAKKKASAKKLVVKKPTAKKAKKLNPSHPATKKSATKGGKKKKKR
jgi:uncharacterized protein YndB with AHSA1/START domain